MLDNEAIGVSSVERTGAPRFTVLVILVSAAVTGYLLTVNITVAMGFLCLLALFSMMLVQPRLLVPALMVLPVFMEATLQSLRISVGARVFLNFYGIVNLGLVAAILFYMMTERMRPFESLLTAPFALYCGAVLLSLVVSANALATMRSLVRILSGYCIYLMITQFITEKRQIDRILRILIVASVVPITVGLYQIAVRNHFALSRDLRIKATITNGMSYAMYLALLLPYVFGQIVFAGHGRAKKGFFVALFLAGLMNLLYASTRIGWGVFVLTMILYALFTDVKRLLPVVLTVLIVLVIVFLPFFTSSFGGFFKTDWNTYMSNDIRWDFRSQDYVTASSLHIRIYVWRNMFHALLKRNVLFGVGSGTWFQNFDRKIIGFPIASHSDYFEVLFGTGLVGLFLYMVFRFKQLILLGRFARSGIERQIKTTVLFPCLAAHIACLGMSITEVWQGYACIYWVSWITMGICECYYKWYLQEGAHRGLDGEIPAGATYH